MVEKIGYWLPMFDMMIEQINKYPERVKDAIIQLQIELKEIFDELVRKQ